MTATTMRPAVLLVRVEAAGRHATKASLRQAGYDVVDCEDPLYAFPLLWHGLRPCAVLLYVTDLETWDMRVAVDLKTTAAACGVPIRVVTDLTDPAFLSDLRAHSLVTCSLPAEWDSILAGVWSEYGC